MDGKLLRRKKEVKGIMAKWQIKVVRLHLGAGGYEFD